MNYTDFIDNARIEGYAVIMLTDEFRIEKYPLKNEVDEDKLLDIRIFNKELEYRLFRDNIGSDFEYRYLDDQEDYFEDIQRLDIDSTKGKDMDGKVTAQGGGKYYLPIELPLSKENDIKVKIHNYIGYDINGIAYIKDFRLVEFYEGEKYV